MHEQKKWFTTHLGCLWEAVSELPRPSCPLVLSPQAKTSPLLVTAKVCICPQATCLMVQVSRESTRAVEQNQTINLCSINKCEKITRECYSAIYIYRSVILINIIVQISMKYENSQP